MLAQRQLGGQAAQLLARVAAQDDMKKTATNREGNINRVHASDMTLLSPICAMPPVVKFLCVLNVSHVKRHMSGCAGSGWRQLVCGELPMLLDGPTDIPTGSVCVPRHTDPGRYAGSTKHTDGGRYAKKEGRYAHQTANMSDRGSVCYCIPTPVGIQRGVVMIRHLRYQLQSCAYQLQYVPLRDYADTDVLNFPPVMDG